MDDSRATNLDSRPRRVQLSSSDVALAHEQLDAYKVAVQLDALVASASKRAPRGHGWLIDQAQRAAGSAVLNLVESNGRTGADRLQHLRIAKGSVLEVDAALTLLSHRGLLKEAERREGHGLAVRLVQMMTAMGRTG